MGFPTIMYLSRSKVGSFWKKGIKQKPVLPRLKAKVSLSLNPELSIETETKKKDEYEIPRSKDGDEWPPFKSLEIVMSMERQLKHDKQIGTMEDLLNKNLIYPCYKLKGRLFIDKKMNRMLYGDITSQGVNGILALEGTDKQVSVDIAFDNIAGISYKKEHWEIWESGAIRFFRQVTSNGYDLIGLFTYEGESDNYLADCGILYFASMASARGYNGRDCKKEIMDTIYNEYM